MIVHNPEDKNFRYTQIYEYLSFTIEQLISEQEKRVGKKEEKNEKNATLLDNALNKRELKTIKDKLVVLRKISNNIFNLRNTYSLYELPEKIDEQLDYLAVFLDEEEKEKINNAINQGVQNPKNVTHEKISNIYEETKKFIDDIKIGQYMVRNNDKFSDKTINYSIDTVYTEVYRTIVPDVIVVTPTKGVTIQEIVNNAYGMETIKNIEVLIQNGKLDLRDRDSKKVIENFPQIRKYYIEKVKAVRICEQIKKIKESLLREEQINEGVKPGVNFIEILQLLDELDKKYNKKIQEAEKFLSKFDLINVKRKVKDILKQENKISYEYVQQEALQKAPNQDVLSNTGVKEVGLIVFNQRASKFKDFLEKVKILFKGKTQNGQIQDVQR